MTTLTRDLVIPAQAKNKMKAHAIATGSTLGADLADIVKTYAEGGYTDGPGVHLDDLPDPGLSKGDAKVRMQIEESVWQQARTRTVLDGTNLATVIRRLAVGLTADTE